jgi:hypothetical protein
MRMDRHITLLGALFIGYHIIGLIIGFVIMTLLSSIGYITGDQTAMTVLTIVGLALGASFVLLSIPGIVAGVWLLKRRSWARILALIVGAFDLIGIPFGTALGAYSFWVLLQDETIQIFESQKKTVATA